MLGYDFYGGSRVLALNCAGILLVDPRGAAWRKAHGSMNSRCEEKHGPYRQQNDMQMPLIASMSHDGHCFHYAFTPGAPIGPKHSLYQCCWCNQHSLWFASGTLAMQASLPCSMPIVQGASSSHDLGYVPSVWGLFDSFKIAVATFCQRIPEIQIATLHIAQVLHSLLRLEYAVLDTGASLATVTTMLGRIPIFIDPLLDASIEEDYTGTYEQGKTKYPSYLIGRSHEVPYRFLRGTFVLLRPRTHESRYG